MSHDIIDREHVGRLMHESWSRTKRAQGFHGPNNDIENCTDKNYIDGMGAFHCQCDKFHPDLIPWDDLPEKQKDINRHAFDDVLPYFERLLADEREKVREKACKFMCWGCERGHPLVKRPEGDNRITHGDPNGWFECNARLFRQLDLTKLDEGGEEK